MLWLSNYGWLITLNQMLLSVELINICSGFLEETHIRM